MSQSLLTTSPAIRHVPFATLVRVERGKMLDPRAARWLLVAAAASTIALMLAPLLATGTFDQRLDTYLEYCGGSVSLLLPVVAVLLMTTEWTQHSALTTFAQVPQRGRVVNAKLAAAGLLCVAAAVFVAVVSTAFLLLSALLGRDTGWALSPSIAIGCVIGIVLNVALGAGLGALLQNTAAAIVLMFLLPVAFGFISGPVGKAGDWFDLTKLFDWITSGHWGGHVVQLIVLMLLWIVAPIVAGRERTVRRDIA